MNSLAQPAESQSIHLSVILLAAVLLGGCSATCEDACTALNACAVKLGGAGQDLSECVSSCELSKELDECEDGGAEFRDCLSEMECESQDAAWLELLGCSGHCPGLFLPM